jgi:hypothetical protein
MAMLAANFWELDLSAMRTAGTAASLPGAAHVYRLMSTKRVTHGIVGDSLIAARRTTGLLVAGPTATPPNTGAAAPEAAAAPASRTNTFRTLGFFSHSRLLFSRVADSGLCPVCGHIPREQPASNNHHYAQHQVRPVVHHVQRQEIRR